LNALPFKISKNAYKTPYLWANKYCYNSTHYAVGSESKSNEGYYVSTLAGNNVSKRSGVQSQDWCRDDYGFRDGSGNGTYTYAAWRDANFNWRDGVENSEGGSTSTP
jgi:hypothetical protein